MTQVSYYNFLPISLNIKRESIALSHIFSTRLYPLSKRVLITQTTITWPGLFLLHTGNIGKLRDSTVPPSMRRLGLSLQDLFVPRSDEPCAVDSALPAGVRACHATTIPWRAALKSLGDCRAMSRARPVPLLWAPGLATGGEAAAAPAMRAPLDALSRALPLPTLVCSAFHGGAAIVC